LILQPLTVVILAILDGLKDARTGRPLYTWTILSDPSQRAGYLHEGLKRVCRVIIFALVMDAIYQFLVLRWFYLGEALVTAFVLAVLPYLLIRGPAARIALTFEPARCDLQGTVSTDAGEQKKHFFNLVFRKRQWKPNLSVVAWHGKNRYMRCT
jgi:hypothetical protein